MFYERLRKNHFFNFLLSILIVFLMFIQSNSSNMDFGQMFDILAFSQLWFSSFLLVSIISKEYSPIHISLSSLIAFLMIALPLELFYHQIMIFILCLTASIYFILKKKNFYRMMAMTMNIASLVTLALMHFLNISVNIDAMAPTRTEQLNTIADSEYNITIDGYCEALSLNCYYIDSENSAKEFYKKYPLTSVSFSNVYRDTQNSVNHIHTWHVGDLFAGKIYLSSFVKNGENTYFIVDIESYKKDILRYSYIYMTQYSAFAISWLLLGIYVINRHRKIKIKKLPF